MMLMLYFVLHDLAVFSKFRAVGWECGYSLASSHWCSMLAIMLANNSASIHTDELVTIPERCFRWKQIRSMHCHWIFSHLCELAWCVFDLAEIFTWMEPQSTSILPTLSLKLYQRLPREAPWKVYLPHWYAFDSLFYDLWSISFVMRRHPIEDNHLVHRRWTNIRCGEYTVDDVDLVRRERSLMRKCHWDVIDLF